MKKDKQAQPGERESTSSQRISDYAIKAFTSGGDVENPKIMDLALDLRDARACVEELAKAKRELEERYKIPHIKLLQTIGMYAGLCTDQFITYQDYLNAVHEAVSDTKYNEEHTERVRLGKQLAHLRDAVLSVDMGGDWVRSDLYSLQKELQASIACGMSAANTEGGGGCGLNSPAAEAEAVAGGDTHEPPPPVPALDCPTCEGRKSIYTFNKSEGVYNLDICHTCGGAGYVRTGDTGTDCPDCKEPKE